jgi:hypothetical protein
MTTIAEHCNARLLYTYSDSPERNSEHQCNRPLGHDDVHSNDVISWTDGGTERNLRTDRDR